MSFLSKLKFWKKRDDFADLGLRGTEAGLGSDLGFPDTSSNFGLGHEQFRQEPTQPQFQQQPYNYPQPSSQPPPMMPQQPPAHESSDKIEVVSSKLDVIKAKLDSVEQRLVNLERIASGDQERRRKTW